MPFFTKEQNNGQTKDSHKVQGYPQRMRLQKDCAEFVLEFMIHAAYLRQQPWDRHILRVSSRIYSLNL